MIHRFMFGHRLASMTACCLLLWGCSTQEDYRRPALAVPLAWSAGATDPVAGLSADETWWRALGDPAIDALTDAALTDNPSLALAIARVDEARASLGVDRAAQLPQLGVGGSFTRAHSLNTVGLGNSPVIDDSTASIGPTLSWEIDLFGRVRQSVEAARDRLDARTADARSARLSVAAQVADTVLSLRACMHARAVLESDIASRERTLSLTRRKLAEGFVAPVDEARAVSGLVNVRTHLVAQAEQCARDVNALVALTGNPAADVDRLLHSPLRAPAMDDFGAAESMPSPLPEPPPVGLALPATILAVHPSVVAAERELAAAWAEIGIARANRFPQLDLSALLTRQWLSAAGQALSFTGWSFGPSLMAPLLDGGRGAANVDAAEARYRQALSRLQSALRDSARDIDNALAALTSAQDRRRPADVAMQAAHSTLAATEAQWKEGAVSLFELEDARRQYATAQDDAIAAARDRGQAWVALIKATGNGVTNRAVLIGQTKNGNDEHIAH